MKFNLNLTSISDIYVRQNFEKLQNAFNALSTVVGVDLIATEITLSDNKITHNLKYIPTDVIVTRFENSAVTIDWLFDQFDEKYLYFSLNGDISNPGPTKYGLNILVGRLSLKV